MNAADHTEAARQDARRRAVRDAQAVAYITATQPDPQLLLEILGLIETPKPEGRLTCPGCGAYFREDGRRTCRRRTCPEGPRARAGSKP